MSWKRPFIVLLSAVIVGVLVAAPVAAQDTSESIADLDGIKTYLLDQADALQTVTDELLAASEAYYAMAEASEFDYDALLANDDAAVAESLTAAKAAWTAPNLPCRGHFKTCSPAVGSVIQA